MKKNLQREEQRWNHYYFTLETQKKGLPKSGISLEVVLLIFLLSNLLHLLLSSIQLWLEITRKINNLGFPFFKVKLK